MLETTQINNRQVYIDENAAPCPECGSTIFWSDPQDELRCFDCHPVLVVRILRELWFVRKNPLGYEMRSQELFDQLKGRMGWPSKPEPLERELGAF